MRKPDFGMCEKKAADQLRSNCAADQHLCFRYMDDPKLMQSPKSCSQIQVGTLRNRSVYSERVLIHGGSFKEKLNQVLLAHLSLNNRKQRVVLPGTSSSWKPIKAGVPQGSILGPLLFLIYINDIVEDVHCNIRLFADDTSLFIIVDDPTEAAQLLNSDMEKIHQWAKRWLVRFNPAKSESLLFSRKINKPFHPPISMNYQVISEVTMHNHLGLTFSNDCTWHEHLAQIKTKAWQRIYIMRKLKFLLDRKSLQTIYFSFIRPLLEYADVVWDNCTQYEVDELEKIQN